MIQIRMRTIRITTRRAVALVIFSCCCFSTANIASAADKPPLSAARLKVWANWAIRTGALEFDPPKNRIENGEMEYADVVVLLEAESDAYNLYVRVLLDQVEIELRRALLLQRPRSRQIMEPYYVKMEQIVAEELAVAEDSKLTADARETKCRDLHDQLHSILTDGLTEVAKSIGVKLAQPAASAAGITNDVTLIASPNATIDMVRPITASLLKEVGLPESDFPWTSYKAGDTAQLLGEYYCRVQLNGKQAISMKKIGDTTKKLEFPDP